MEEGDVRDILSGGGGGSGGDVIEEGDVSAEVMEKGSLSPLTGSYLLIVLAEPHSDEDREIILERLNKGLLSWDVDSSHVDLNCELLNLANSSPEGDEARNGEKLVQWASENLVVEVLIHSQVNTLQQCMKNLLASFTRHRHIIHSGYTFQGSGSWVLQDGTFSLNDYLELWSEGDVQRILSAYKGDISVAVHCASENGWTQERLSKEPFAKMCQIHMNPTTSEKMSQIHNAGVSSFIEYISKLLTPSPLKEILEPSDIVGKIRFSHPTLYVFPGGQGDAALFGINGFNMLIDGGFSRRSCFWDFTRHLDRLDAVLLTRVNNNSVGGLSSVIQRKVMNQVYPQIGHFFGNVMERRCGTGEKDKGGEKDKEKGGEIEHQHGEKLLVSLTDEGQKMLDNLRNINLKPHLCFRETHIEPINLYHKVGHGKLDLYILNPAKDSREVKEFLSKWNSDCKSFVSSRISLRQQQQQQQHDGKDFQYPVLNLVSICALLVWQPANPRDPITRILFPGSTPQHKIFEALQKLKHLEFLKYPVCSAKTIAASNKSKVKSEKIISEAKQQLSKVSSHGNMTGSSLQPSSTEGSLSRTAAGATTASAPLSKSSLATTTTGKLSEEKEKERVGRGKSKIGMGDSNKVQGGKTESPAPPKRQPRSTSKSGGVGGTIGKTPSTTRVPSKGPPSTRRSAPLNDVEKIGSSTIPKKISPTSPAKKSMESSTTSTTSKIGIKSSTLSKTGLGGRSGVDSTPPPSTPPKSAKESANRRVIEYKSHLTKSNVKTDMSGKVGVKSGEIKKRTSSSTIGSTGKSIPKSPPSNAPVPVKRSISERTKGGGGGGGGGIGAKEIIATTAAATVIGGVVAAGELLVKKDQSPPPESTSSPIKIPDSEDFGEEKKIQAETNGSIISSRGENGEEGEEEEDGEEDKSGQKEPLHEPQEELPEEPTSLPLLAATFLPTESGSELSSLDHMSLHEEEVEHHQETQQEQISTDTTSTTAVISSSQDLSIGGEEQQPFDSLTLQDEGVIESEQDEEDEEDEYLIIEKDESTADNAENSERVQSKAAGSLDEISTVPVEDVEVTGEIPEGDSSAISKQEEEDEEKESKISASEKDAEKEEEEGDKNSVQDQHDEEEADRNLKGNEGEESLTSPKDTGLQDDGEDAAGKSGTEAVTVTDVTHEEELVETDVVPQLVSNEDGDGGVESKSGDDERDIVEDEKENNLDKLTKDEDENEMKGIVREEIVAKSLADELESAIDDEERASRKDSLVAKEEVGTQDEEEKEEEEEEKCVDDKLQREGLEETTGNGEKEEVQSIVECSSVKNSLERESNILELKESVAEQLEVGRCKREEEETEFPSKDVEEGEEEEERDHLKSGGVGEDEECEKVGENESENIVKKDFSTVGSTVLQEEFPGNNLAFQGETDKVEELVVQLEDEGGVGEDKDMPSTPLTSILPVKVDLENGEDVTPPGLKDAVVEDGKVKRWPPEDEKEQVVLGEKSPYDTHQELTLQEQREEPEKGVELKIKSLEEQVQMGRIEEENGKQKIKDLKRQVDDEICEEKLDHVPPPSQDHHVEDDVETDKDKTETTKVELERDVDIEHDLGVVVQDIENSKIDSQPLKQQEEDIGNDTVIVVDGQQDTPPLLFKEDYEESEKSKTIKEETFVQGHIEDSSLEGEQKDHTDLPTELPEVEPEQKGGEEKLEEMDIVQSAVDGKRQSIVDQVEDDGEHSQLPAVVEKVEEITLTKGDNGERLGEALVKVDHSVSSQQFDREEEIRKTIIKEDQKDVGHEELKVDDAENDATEKMLLKNEIQYQDQQGIQKEEEEEKVNEKLADVVQRDDDKLDDMVVEAEQTPLARKTSTTKSDTKEQEEHDNDIILENKGEQKEDKSEESMGADKFIRPLPYEETMDSEGAIEKILLMKDTRDVKEGKSSLIDNEGEKRKGREDGWAPQGEKVGIVGGVSGIASAIPKLPRESREVIRTPDEVAELPMHEEVEPGTYETDEVVDEHEPEEFSEEDPGVETIGISNLPSALTTLPTTVIPIDDKKCRDVAVEELEKIDKINISHETFTPTTLPHLNETTTSSPKVDHMVENVHQEIILTSSSVEMVSSEVKKCDAALSPVLESLLGQSPPKIFPGEIDVEKLQETERPSDDQLSHQVDQRDEENGNVVESDEQKDEIEQISPSLQTKESNEDESRQPTELGDDKNKSELIALDSVVEDSSSPPTQVNMEEEKKVIDKKLTLDKNRGESELSPGLETKPMTSVVITPSTPPVHKDLEKSEFNYSIQHDKGSEESGESDCGEKKSDKIVGESCSGGVTSSEINDAVKLVRGEEGDEKSKVSLLSGGEHERKLSDNSDESSTSSATPLTAVSKESKPETMPESKVEEEEEREGDGKEGDDAQVEKVMVTHLPESIQVMEKVSVKEEDDVGEEEEEVDTGIVRGGMAVKSGDVEKLFLLPGKEDGDKSDVDDDDIYETDEAPALASDSLGAIRSGLLTAATTLSAAVISQSPEDLATIPTFNENEIIESIVSTSKKTTTTTTTATIGGDKVQTVHDVEKSKVLSQIEDKPTSEGQSNDDDDDEKVSMDNLDLQSGTKMSDSTLPKDDKEGKGEEDSCDDNIVKIVEDIREKEEDINSSSRRSSGALSSSGVIETRRGSLLDSGSVVVDGSIQEECSREKEEEEEESVVGETREESNVSCPDVELANKLLSFQQKEEEDKDVTTSEEKRAEEIFHENIELSPPSSLLPLSNIEKSEGEEEKRDEEKPIVPLPSSTTLPSTSQSISTSMPQKENNAIDIDIEHTEQMESGTVGGSKLSSTIQLDDKELSTRKTQIEDTIGGDQGHHIDKQIKSNLTGSEEKEEEEGTCENQTHSIVNSKLPTPNTTDSLATVNVAIEETLSTTTTSRRSIGDLEENVITKVDVIKGDKSIEIVDINVEDGSNLLSDSIVLDTVEERSSRKEDEVGKESENDIIAMSVVTSFPPTESQHELVDSRGGGGGEKLDDEIASTTTTTIVASSDDSSRISKVSEAEKVVSAVIEAADRKVEAETKVVEEILLQVEEKLMTVTPSPSVILDRDCVEEKCDKEKVLPQEENKEAKEEEEEEDEECQKDTKDLMTEPDQKKSSTPTDTDVIVPVDAVIKSTSKNEDKGTMLEVNNLVSEGVSPSPSASQEEKNEEIGEVGEEDESVENLKDVGEKKEEYVEEKAEEESSEKSIVSSTTALETQPPPPSTSLKEINTSSRKSSSNISPVETNGEEASEANLEALLTSQFNLKESEENKSILFPSNFSSVTTTTGATTSSSAVASQEETEDPCVVYQSMGISRDAKSQPSIPHEHDEEENEREISQSLVTHASDKATTSTSTIEVETKISKAIQDSSTPADDDTTQLSARVKSESVGDDGDDDGEEKEHSIIISATQSDFPSKPDAQDCTIASGSGGSPITTTSPPHTPISVQSEETEMKISSPTSSPITSTSVTAKSSHVVDEKSLIKENLDSFTISSFDTKKIEESASDSIVTSSLSSTGKSTVESSSVKSTKVEYGSEIGTSFESLEKQMDLIIHIEPKLLAKDEKVSSEDSNKMSTDLDNLKQLEIEKKIWSKEMESSSHSSQLKDKDEVEIGMKSTTIKSCDSSIVDPQLKDSYSIGESWSEDRRESVEKLKGQDDVVGKERLFEGLEDLSSSRREGETSHSSMYHTIETSSQFINLAEKSNIEESLSNEKHSVIQTTSSLSNGKGDDSSTIVKDYEIQQQYSSILSSENENEIQKIETRKLSSDSTTVQDKAASSHEIVMEESVEKVELTEGEKFVEKSLSSMQEKSVEKEEEERVVESKKSDSNIIVKTDGGNKTTIMRRFSSQEIEGVVGESVKSLESRRRASEIIEHSEEIYAGTSLSKGSTVPTTPFSSSTTTTSTGATGATGSNSGIESTGVTKQFVEIVERDNEIAGSRTSPGGSFYGGYGYVFGSAADDETEENPEDDESVYGGEDSQSHSLSTRDSNQSIIISTDFIPSSTTSSTTTTVVPGHENVSHPTSEPQQQHQPHGKEETIKVDTVGQDVSKIPQELSHLEETTTTVPRIGDKSEFLLGESKSSTSQHLTMSYDLMDEGSYSSGEFSDSQLSTVAGREQGGLDDDNVHNYGYTTVSSQQQQQQHQQSDDDKIISTTNLITTTSSQDFENGNLPTVQTTTSSSSSDLVTTSSYIINPCETTTTTTISSSTKLNTFETTNNGNTPTSTTITTTVTKTEGDGPARAEKDVKSDASSTAPTAPSSSSSSSQKKDDDDIVKTWGKPLGLPPIQADDQPPSSNFHETAAPAPAATTTTGAGAGVNPSDSGLAKGTPKKDKSVDRKNPTTPGKTIHGSSTSRGISHHRSTKNISPIYVDLAYVPHHGNSNYCDSEFFRLVRSRYYVFSGLEPSRQVFEGLLQGKQSWEDKNLEVTIIPTYDTDTLGYWVVDSEDALGEARIDLAPSASRCTINLQDHETSCSAYRLEF